MNSVTLKNAGLKTTHPRKLILELLETASQRHFSAEEVYRRLLDQGENIGIATVYRVLAQFENASLVTRHHFEGVTAVFELNRGEHHDHLVCIDCGAIIEFTDDEIEALQSRVAEREGFRIRDHSLYIFGTCQDPDNCARAQERKALAGTPTTVMPDGTS